MTIRTSIWPARRWAGFSAVSLSGKTLVFGSSGIDGSDLALDLAGTMVFGSSNALSGSMAVNDLSAYGVNTITGGSYTIDATGRVTITNVTLSAITVRLRSRRIWTAMGTRC